MNKITCICLGVRNKKTSIGNSAAQKVIAARVHIKK